MTNTATLPSYEEIQAIEMRARLLRAQIMLQAVADVKTWFANLIPTAVVHEPS